jgi:hypothetical protein
VEVFTLKGEPARGKFLEIWDKMEDKESIGVSTRGAVVAGDKNKMKFQLQAMLAPASIRPKRQAHPSG